MPSKCLSKVLKEGVGWNELSSVCMSSSRGRSSKQMSKRARVEDTSDVESSRSSSESEDDVLQGAALKKRIAPILQLYPTINHKSESSRKLYEQLSARAIKPNRYIHGELLRSHDLFDEVKRLLENVGWSDLLRMKEPSYSKLTMEFLSSFKYHESKGFSFRIANFSHKVSNAQVANMFGWIEDTSRVPVNFEKRFWQLLTQKPHVSYLACKATSSQIVSPAYRYMHKVLNHTIYGRGESLGGVSKEVLAILYGMHYGIKLDFSTLLAKRFTDVAKRVDGSIVIGGFITRIAERIGAFDRRKTNLVAVEGCAFVDESTCINMGLLERVSMEIYELSHVIRHLLLSHILPRRVLLKQFPFCHWINQGTLLYCLMSPCLRNK